MNTDQDADVMSQYDCLLGLPSLTKHDLVIISFQDMWVGNTCLRQAEDKWSFVHIKESFGTEFLETLYPYRELAERINRCVHIHFCF